VRVVVRVVAVLAMHVVVVMVPVALIVAVVLEEVGVDVKLGVEVEALEVEHLGNGHFAEVHALLRCPGVHVLDTVGQVVGLGSGDQIGLADEDLVGKTDLAARFLALVKLRLAVLGVDQGDDGVEQVELGDFVVHEEGLGDGARVGHAGGFDHHAVEGEGAGFFLFGQIGQGVAQILADRAADAPIVHLDDLFLGVGHEDVVVDVFLAEFIFNDGDALTVCFGQEAFEQRRFAAAEETGEDGDRNQAHLTSVALPGAISMGTLME